MQSPRLSLRRRPVVKPPPPGVELATEPPRNESLRLETIVEATRESSERHTQRESDDHEAALEKSEATLAKAEKELAEKDRELREREAMVVTRELEAREMLKLAEVRENQAARREALLADNREALQDAGIVARLQAELDQSHRDTAELQTELEAAHLELASARDQLAEFESTATHSIETDALTPEQSASFAEQERLLREREAFIEESENTLFHRAQELQELEMHLEQWKEVLSTKAAALGVEDSMPDALLSDEDLSNVEPVSVGVEADQKSV